jgi:hypothetical protein
LTSSPLQLYPHSVPDTTADVANVMYNGALVHFLANLCLSQRSCLSVRMSERRSIMSEPYTVETCCYAHIAYVESKHKLGGICSQIFTRAYTTVSLHTSEAHCALAFVF